MTQDEIQTRINSLLGKMDGLEMENAEMRKNIEDIENGDKDALSLQGKWENALSDCFNSVKNGLKNVNENSGFISYYQDKINEILSSKEASEISDCLGMVRTEIKSKINEFENVITDNNSRIHQIQREIDELRALQNSGAE